MSLQTLCKGCTNCETLDPYNPINSLRCNVLPPGSKDLQGNIGCTRRYDPCLGNEGIRGIGLKCCSIGCSDLGCGSGCDCPPKVPPMNKVKCEAGPLPCCGTWTDARAHHINRGPYCCPCRSEPDPCVYRCCEGMIASYSGHVPGFTFHSLARNFNRATLGTKSYMQNCFYYNTWSKI